jgi:uncharacterized DUF497 family protein
MRFEWDENKNELNKAKHSISFETAESVFLDKDAIYLYDEIHSNNEDRFIVIGKEDTLKTELTVCHCYRGSNDEIIRIISARRATKKEARIYITGGAEE